MQHRCKFEGAFRLSKVEGKLKNFRHDLITSFFSHFIQRSELKTKKKKKKNADINQFSGDLTDK